APGPRVLDLAQRRGDPVVPPDDAPELTRGGARPPSVAEISLDDDLTRQTVRESALIVGRGAEREREAVRNHLVTEPGHLCSERQGGLANVVHCCKEDRKPARLLGIPHRNLDDAPSLLTHPPVPEQLCRISRVGEMLVERKPSSQLATLVDPALGPY